MLKNTLKNQALTKSPHTPLWSFIQFIYYIFKLLVHELDFHPDTLVVMEIIMRLENFMKVFEDEICLLLIP